MVKIKYIILIFVIFSLIIIFWGGLVSGVKSVFFERNKISSDLVEKKLKIIFVSPMIGHPVWLDAKYGMDAAASEFGFEGVWMGADDHSIKKTVEELENAIATLPDSIITCPFISESFTPSLIKAEKLGIPVVVLAVDTEYPALRKSFIGTDSWEAGTLQIKTIHSIVGDRMKIGIFMSNLDAGNQLIQIDAIKDYIKDIPGSKIVAIEENFADKFIAKEKFSAMIDRYPEMNALIGTEGGGSSAYGDVLDKRNLKDKITVISMDDSEENLKALREGKIYGITAQNFYKMGYLGAKYAFLAASGETVPSYINSGVTMITMDNIDTYKSE